MLTAAPRVASVTAAVDTTLLRLDQAALFELMADQPAMTQDILHTVSPYLQNALQQLSAADARIAQLAPTERADTGALPRRTVELAN